LQVFGVGGEKATVNTLAFIASVIGSLAWPVTLLIVILILLRNGTQLAKFVKTIRFKDFELTLRSEFEKARTIAEEIEVGLALPPVRGEREESEDKVLALAQIDPGVAVLKSWQKLEEKLTSLIQHNGLIRVLNRESFVDRLVQLNKISATEKLLFERLRIIRDIVVHGSKDGRSMSVAEVVEYDQLVDTLVRRLQQIQEEPGYIDPK
jgi:hypothetical protein